MGGGGDLEDIVHSWPHRVPSIAPSKCEVHWVKSLWTQVWSIFSGLSSKFSAEKVRQET